MDVCMSGVVKGDVSRVGEGLINRVWVVRKMLRWGDGVYGLVCTRIAFGNIRTRKTVVVERCR